MHPVKATFEAIDQPFPSGTVATGFLFLLTPVQSADAPADSPAPASYTVTAPLDAREVTIADVEPGTYVGSIALVDAGGEPLAEAVEAAAPITVPVTTSVTFPVPTSLALTLP